MRNDREGRPAAGSGPEEATEKVHPGAGSVKRRKGGLAFHVSPTLRVSSEGSCPNESGTAGLDRLFVMKRRFLYVMSSRTASADVARILAGNCWHWPGQQKMKEVNHEDLQHFNKNKRRICAG